MRFAQSAGPVGKTPGCLVQTPGCQLTVKTVVLGSLCLEYFGSIFLEFRTILDTLLALWGTIWGHFGHLGVTFGAPWLHFWSHLVLKKRTGAPKVRTSGATPCLESPLGYHF